MKNVADYLDAARAAQGFKSDLRLSVALEVAQSAVVKMRAGEIYPSDDTMIRLAVLARADVKDALLNLNIWRAKTPAVRERYKDLKRSLRHTAAAAVIGATPLISSGNSDADTHAMVESHSPEQFILC